MGLAPGFGTFLLFCIFGPRVFPPINGCELNLMIIINDAADGKMVELKMEMRRVWISIRGIIYQKWLNFKFVTLFFFSIPGSIYRRGARRWRKLYRINGHIFQAKRFNRVSQTHTEKRNSQDLVKWSRKFPKFVCASNKNEMKSPSGRAIFLSLFYSRSLLAQRARRLNKYLRNRSGTETEKKPPEYPAESKKFSQKNVQ